MIKKVFFGYVIKTITFHFMKTAMCILEDFISSLQEFLIGDNKKELTIIRKHTKKLTELGDISFPLNINNWYQFIGNKTNDLQTIFEYKFRQLDEQIILNKLIEKSSQWHIEVSKIVFKNSDVHIFFKQSLVIYQTVLKEILDLSNNYGSCNIINSKISLNFSKKNTQNLNEEEIDLTILRLILLRDVTKNLIKFTCDSTTDNITSDLTKENITIYLVTKPIDNAHKYVLCGPVINEKGVKSSYTAQELYQKRSSDMRMMAQHKYGVQVKPNLAWESYFEKLGKASVTIEILTNKPQKSIKISLHDLQSANKGASFIFYNCARLAALFKEFDKRIATNEYPELPNVENVDFSLLNQPEEWELFYVYMLQFPMVIKSCIKDIEKGVLNPQHLISFLSNLSSLFSVYYRRVRILTNPREHMYSVIHARIYLLKGLQCVMHNALRLLNIEPVKEM